MSLLRLLYSSRWTLTGLLVVSIMAAGGAVAWWSTWWTERQWRDDLVRQAQFWSEGLNLKHVSALSETEASATDQTGPVYQRLQDHLELVRESIAGCLSLRLVGRRHDGGLFLVVGSRAVSSDGSEVRPLDAHTHLLEEIFATASAGARGPVSYNGKQVMTALIPLADVQRENIVAVLVVDVDAADLNVQRGAQVASILGFAGLLALILIVGTIVRQSQAAKPENQGKRAPLSLSHAESVLTLMLGLTVTAGISYLAHGIEARAREATFYRLGSSRVTLLSDALRDLEDQQLEGLARFFEGSQEVERSEFQAYTSFLASDPGVRFWLWVPAVDSSERHSLQEFVRNQGIEGFTVWERDSEGLPTPVDRGDNSYPILFVTPLEGNESLLGYDLGSSSVSRTAIQRAARSRLPTASDLVDLPRGRESSRSVLVFRPVYQETEARNLSGFAVGVPHLETLLHPTVGERSLDGSSSVNLTLYQLKSGAKPGVLLGTPSDRGTGPFQWFESGFDWRGEFVVYKPLETFGQTYALVARPETAFASLYPQRAAWAAAIGGSLLTVLLAVLVGSVVNRRLVLEQRVAERTAALQASEARYRSLFQNYHTVMLIIDPDGASIVDANPAAAAYYGWPLNHLRQMTIKEINTLPPEEIEAEMQQALREERDHFAFQHRLADGSIRDVEVLSGPISLDGRSLLFSIVHDVTERKKAEKEREELQARFLQAQKMESVGRLAGGVAHDFNNQLTVIIGLAETILDEAPLTPDWTHDLREILKAARNSAELTRQLLGFARRQTVNPQVLDLNERVAEMLKVLRRLLGENIELQWRPMEDLWKVRIDPAQVSQILVNLAVNARDAIDRVGSLQIETRNALLDEAFCENQIDALPGDYVMLKVSDNGSGMDESVLEHAFEPFFTTKEAGRGTGLGLATVYGIVRQNDGMISIDSKAGKGTSVTVYFPRIEPLAAEESVLSDREAPAGAETVLLVEDEVAILQLGQRILERRGYTVLAAETPEKALRLVREHDGPIHILVTDVVMPQMSGKELEVSVRRLHPQLKVLYMSGYPAEVIARQGILDRGVEFLQKPFSVAGLTSRVREVLDR